MCVITTLSEDALNDVLNSSLMSGFRRSRLGKKYSDEACDKAVEAKAKYSQILGGRRAWGKESKDHTVRGLGDGSQ